MNTIKLFLIITLGSLMLSQSSCAQKKKVTASKSNTLYVSSANINANNTNVSAVNNNDSVIISDTLYNRASNVYIFQGSFEEAKALSQKLEKPLFIDFYTKWCAPCKQMDKDIENTYKIYDMLNSNFIYYKVDGESFDGYDLIKSLNVKAYPTYVFINRKGKESFRFTGYTNVDQLYYYLRKYYY